MVRPYASRPPSCVQFLCFDEFIIKTEIKVILELVIKLPLFYF